MKIVEVAEFYSERGGGVRTYLHQLLVSSVRHGHETVIIAPGSEDREEVRPGGKIVWVRAPRLIVDPRYHIFASSAAVDRVIAREAPDVVVGGSPWKGGWIAGRWRGTGISQPVKALVMHADPVAVYAYTLLGGAISTHNIDRLFGWFWRYLARLSMHFDVTLAGSQWLADRLSGHGLARVRAVPFGVELDAFSPTARDLSLRAEMLKACGLPESAALVLTVGRHHPEKRLATVIDAVAQAQRSRPVGLYMVGDGPFRTWINRHAARRSNVFVAGHVDDRDRVAALMASADVLLHGSAAETFGRVLAEALAAGLPIVIPDQGGAAQFAGPTYAEVYRTGDAGAAAAGLLAMLGRDRSIVSRAAVVAAAHVGSEDDHFARLFSCFAELIEQRRGARGVAA